MLTQMTHISVFQSSKVLAILSFIISILYAIPLGFYTLSTGDKELAIALFLQPILHLVVVYISSIIIFLLYNLVAKGLGGIEFTLATQEKISKE